MTFNAAVFKGRSIGSALLEGDETGDIPDVYAHYGIDTASIVDMAATACLGR